MDNDLERGPYKEDAVRVAGVRSLGACCWVFLGLVAFAVLGVSLLWPPPVVPFLLSRAVCKMRGKVMARV